MPGFDLRDALRLLLRNRAYTIAVVLLLALGTGVSTGIFSIVNAVLLQPLPYRNADQLALVWAGPSFRDRPGLDREAIAALRSRTHVFAGMARFQIEPVPLALGADQARIVQGALVGTHLFSVLGVQPWRGRAFAAQDSLPGSAPVAMISHALWLQLGGESSHVVGSSLRVGGRLCSVIGVMPAGFFFPNQRVQIWLPLHDGTAAANLVQMLTRLRPDVSFKQAQAELHQLHDHSPSRSAAQHADTAPALFPLSRVITGQSRTALWTLFAASLALLLIACANASNLLLARGIGREHELAIRAALGAGRATLVRLLLAESFLLALAGAVLGIGWAWVGVRVFLRLHLADLPRIHTVAIDCPVILFALCVAIVSGALCGLLPLRRACRPDLLAGLQLGRQGTMPGRHAATRSWLVALEMALALVLLAATGLLANSFVRMIRFNWGFDPHHVALLTVQPPAAPAERLTWVAAARQTLARIPGVISIATASGVPLQYGFQGTRFAARGRRIEWAANRTAVSPGYFRALKIPVLRGRTFNAADAGGPPVIVVDASFARRLWPGESPVGKQLQILKLRSDLQQKSARDPRHALLPADLRARGDWVADGTPLRVIGEVADVRMYALDLQPTPNLYVEESRSDMVRPLEHIILRTTAAPQDVLPLARRHLLRTHRDARIVSATTMDALVAAELGNGASPRLILALTTIFGVLALVLALSGVYSVVSFAVAQRTREIGIRKALGGSSAVILQATIGRELTPLLSGLAFGLVLTAVLAHLLQRFLFHLSALDPLTFTLALLVLILGALLACVRPALRALHVHPADLLRVE